MHFHYFLVTLSLMFRKLDISLFLCIWNFCVLCFFNVEFGYPRSVGLSGTLRLAFGKKLFGKGGTRSSQRSQESDTARWCPWSVLRGNSREADSDTPFRSLCVHVFKSHSASSIRKVELGSCPANLLNYSTYHFRKCSGTLPSTSAGVSEELRLVSVSPIFFSKHEFCSTDMDLFQQRLWHLELGTHVKYLNALQVILGTWAWASVDDRLRQIIYVYI